MRKSANKSKPAPPRFPVWLVAVLLALVTVAVFWPATRYEFINFDDPEYITANPHVQAGLTWGAVKWALTNTQQAAYWAPLTWLSHILAFQFFGLNPWGHHLFNILLHAASASLVFLVFRRMTGATWRSAFVAALFAFHPLRVESVAWVAERKDVLSTLFWLLTMWAYVRYVQKSEVGSQKSDSRPLTSGLYWLSLTFFACGLMSKAMLVTLPCVLLLLDYWPLKRFQPSTFNLQLFREKLPFFALAAAVSAITVMAQKHGGAMVTMEKVEFGARIGNALVSYCRYLGKLFWPVDLAVFYPHPGQWPVVQVLLAGALLGVLTTFFFMRRRHPFLLVGWLWFVGTLVPVIGLLQVGEVAMADRFTYVPCLGVLLVAVWGAHELARNWRHRAIVLSAVSLAAIVSCVAATRQQLGYWKDSESLFRRALAVTQNNHHAHNNLGIAFAEKGRTDEAISQFQESVRLQPVYADACYNLGNALAMQGRTGEAVSQFQKAILLQPDNANAHYNLGNTFLMQSQTDQAASQFQEAVRLRPDNADARNNFGFTLFLKGRTHEAISQFQEALRLNPDNAKARANLAAALAAMESPEMTTPSPVK